MSIVTDEMAWKAFMVWYNNDMAEDEQERMRAALEAVADDMVRAENEACERDVDSEHVDMDSEDESDRSYNQAIDDAMSAIRSRRTKANANV